MIVRQGVLHERNENPKRKTTTWRKGATSRINKRGKISRGGMNPRNHIWEVRSKASTPEMTNKPLKAFLHRKADKVRRCLHTAGASIEASSISDIDESARFNFWIICCVIFCVFAVIKISRSYSFSGNAKRNQSMY